ncbi:NAD-dependent epimerase/dehydratase family protein [Halomarina litorea]|uniref:NAD-dependent epimerase/dehydratase family protein n=1 Tax=Halomarina litorea TaxID=2961595 RepID=UPI0020C25FA5|nr:NAD-dependent epimerase/dehydratase family protein [Halomarina sp. BCD28]
MSASIGRIAVFGGGGFIGSHLTRRLLANGYHLDVVDISSEKIGDVLGHDRLQFHELDIYEPENDAACAAIVERSDLVVDLIAYANPEQYVAMPLEVVDLNLFQNLKIVEDCIEAETRLIQFSTCEVYGMLGNRTGDDTVFDEDTSNLIMGPVGNQRWIYATAKQLLERMVYAHGERDGLDWTIVRPFNFIGPEMDYIIESPDEGTPRVFASFMSALMYDHPMFLVDGGKNMRTFTHIEDAIDALELIIENEGGRYTREVVNIGTPGNETTIRGFADLMRDIYREESPDGRLPPMREVDGEEYYGEGYEDCDRRIPGVDKLREAGWTPRYDLRATLENAMRYYIDKYELERAPSPALSD